MFLFIDLSVVKSLQLFDRIETKYLCDRKLLKDILSTICGHYFLTVNGKQKRFNYKSIYFDTDNLDTYIDHCEGKLYRQKIRIREYDNNDKYIEIKSKKDHKIIKKRIKTDNYSITDNLLWIKDNLIYNTDTLNKKLEITYQRVTLVSKDYNQRITIDLNIKFRNYLTGKTVDFNGIIIEAKNKQGYIGYADSLLDPYKKSFSKYKYGIKHTLPE